MLKKRINIKDIPNEEFYKLPKVFIWKKQYRENLSIGAKLLYMLIRDRFNLSIYTTQISVDNGNDTPAFVDEKGDIYCILDNQEIEFSLNISNKTVTKFMEELIAEELVSTESVDGGANRIYLNEPDPSGASLAHFLGEKEYYKHVKMRKKKKKEPLKTLEECIATAIDKYGVKKVDKKNSITREGEIPVPSDGKSTPLSEEKTPPLGEEKVHPNNIYSSNLDLSEIYPNENDTNPNKSSKSKIDEEPIEELTNNIVLQKNNYALLNPILEQVGICPDLKALNVVKKILAEAGITTFHKVDVLNAIGKHAMNVKKYLSQGEVIEYEPAFFANNLVDRIRENTLKRQNEVKKLKKIENQQTYETTFHFSSYNWLEAN
ncbi:replication initiator A domain-containing protein [Bacillus toyonensis]|nr:replication initiator protein A [Bacillus toyonensis]PED94953.1 replication initiator A domain-containing protein [Bacillus toyonensis]PEM82878.1 replication initiator A domain-containing protein [Bacillus toyonensis]